MTVHCNNSVCCSTFSSHHVTMACHLAQRPETSSVYVLTEAAITCF